MEGDSALRAYNHNSVFLFRFQVIFLFLRNPKAKPTQWLRYSTRHYEIRHQPPHTPPPPNEHTKPREQPTPPQGSPRPCLAQPQVRAPPRPPLTGGPHRAPPPVPEGPPAAFTPGRARDGPASAPRLLGGRRPGWEPEGPGRTPQIPPEPPRVPPGLSPPGQARAAPAAFPQPSATPRFWKQPYAPCAAQPHGQSQALRKRPSDPHPPVLLLSLPPQARPAAGSNPSPGPIPRAPPAPPGPRSSPGGLHRRRRKRPQGGSARRGERPAGVVRNYRGGRGAPWEL